jgi:hypothetical protein
VRRRLRPTPDKAALDQLYREPHQHKVWEDHRVRVDVTTHLATHMIGTGALVADLSCGDATIARRLQMAKAAKLILGDYAPGYDLHGPIEETIHQIGDRKVDLFICSETIEHLHDPDSVLAEIRRRADSLILSTPDGEDDDSNPEHLWGWDTDAVGDMLEKAGFTPAILNVLDLRPAGFAYSYQIWCCR